MRIPNAAHPSSTWCVHTFPVSTIWVSNESEHLFLCLWSILKSFIACLTRFLPIFLMGFLIALWSSLNILSINPCWLCKLPISSHWLDFSSPYGELHLFSCQIYCSQIYQHLLCISDFCAFFVFKKCLLVQESWKPWPQLGPCYIGYILKALQFATYV